MTIFRRRLLVFASVICFVTTSCDEEPGEPPVIAINNGTVELTEGYITTSSRMWDDQRLYRHHFLLLGKELGYDTTRFDFSGRGDMGNFTIITSTPELPDGTYALTGTLEGGSVLETIFFVRDFYREHNPDPAAIENLWTDYFAERFSATEGHVQVTSSGDSYTIRFDFGKYDLYENSDNETKTEANKSITGTFSGSLTRWTLPQAFQDQ